jgi:hypothetical protein
MFDTISLVKVESRGGSNVESYDLDLLSSKTFFSCLSGRASTLKLQIDIDHEEQHVAFVIEGKPMIGEHMLGKEIVSAIYVPIKIALEHYKLIVERLIKSWELVANPIQIKEVLKEKTLE